MPMSSTGSRTGGRGPAAASGSFRRASWSILELPRELRSRPGVESSPTNRR
ncbi:hypothetical protein BHE74_00038458, partial [Ensete ventricosum]